MNHAHSLALRLRLSPLGRHVLGGATIVALAFAPVIRAADIAAATPDAAAMLSSSADEPQKLLEGDDIRISFPGAANLDTVQKIRGDGKISLPLIGEAQAAGLTPLELQKALTSRYTPELNNPEVNVTIVAATFPIYVNGAVMHPGEVRCDRPVTVLEAIAKAGGFDFVRAKLDKVTVLRRGEKVIEINMKAVLQGKDTRIYMLKPSDVVMVWEKGFWF